MIYMEIAKNGWSAKKSSVCPKEIASTLGDWVEMKFLKKKEDLKRNKVPQIFFRRYITYIVHEVER